MKIGQVVTVSMEITGGSGGGTSDAFGTAYINSLVLPYGVTLTYDSDIPLGTNALNFQAANSVPEPSSLVLIMSGALAAFAARRLRPIH